ncbi:MAG: biopolymer transporter ExbD [Flavobacteriaceae bacterium]|nr:biopolymer transporter ExbD [Flavobacteriaceae bacterium]
MARRNAPEVNAGSMADIAFLLLIFFLVTTTMETQTGIFRKLPSMEKVDNPPKIEKRNLLSIKVNKNDEILFNGELINVKQITKKTKDFIENKANSKDFPEIVSKDIEGYGKADVSKGVVSLQNDRGTTYEVYIAVQDALASAFEEIRNEKAREIYHKSYAQLVEDKDDEKIEIIKKIVPMSISEAEPKNIK